MEETASVTSHPLYARITQAMDSIRPYLEADGGDMRIANITADGVVEMELLGNCGTCPMSAMTLKAGVEDAIRNAVPEISKVVAVGA